MARLASIFMTASTITAAQNFPSNVEVRVAQRDDFGTKLKVSYNLNSRDVVQMCADCDVDSNGERMSSKGYETTGDTCGGYPHGCAVIQNAEWIFELETVALHFRVGESLWSRSSEQNTFSTKGVTKGTGVVYLLRIEESEDKKEENKDEL